MSEFRYGIQSHFNEPIGADRCAALKAIGFQMCRIDAMTCSVDVLHEMIAEVTEAGLQPLVIVADETHLHELPKDIDIELGNEWDGDISSRDYRALLDTVCAAAAERGQRVWAPAISNLSEPAFKWANAVRDAGGGWPAGMYGVSVHRYGPGGPVETPHSGFASRDNEVSKWLYALCQGKPFMCSEFGWDTAVLSEEQAAERIGWEWEFWENHGAYAAVLYQINDGSGNDPHADYGLYRTDGTIKQPIADTVPKPPAPEPEPEPEPEPIPEPEPEPERFPVPPGPIDLTSYPRRGATIAGSLLDTRWNYDEWVGRLGSVFAGRSITQVNVWQAIRSQHPYRAWPTVMLPSGKWDLYQKGPAFWARLPEYVRTANRHGVIPQLCVLERYSWGDKDVDFDQNLQPLRNNVNGIFFAGDDVFLAQKLAKGIGPEADWLKWFVTEICTALRGMVYVIVPYNEGREKPLHMLIAKWAKAADPGAWVCANRSEDTPGQWQNMDVKEGLIDLLAHHGWKDLGFLTKYWGPKDTPTADSAKRPWTFKEFFENKHHNGNSAGIDFSRVVVSSDGARSSSDPIDTYNYLDLRKVWKFCAGKGCNLEHQSRAKMAKIGDRGWDPGDLNSVEWDDLKYMAEL